MNIFRMTRKFRKDDEGAVTVDWVVLTAAIVGMGVAVMTTVKNGTDSVATKISQGLGAVSVTGAP
jgi:Flp pilus assembly pilin Flp